jgi:hypothetical protein
MRLHIPSDRLSLTGLDIGTGAAIETLISKNLLNFYQRYLINIDTIIRNVVNVMEGKSKDKIRFLKQHHNLIKIAKKVLEEIDIILDNFSNSDTEIIFYIPNYKVVASKLKSRFRKIDEFRGLRYYQILTQYVIYEILLNIGEGRPILKTSHKLLKFMDDYSKTLITTHNGIDLLNYSYNPRVHLIESYTGEIRKYDSWYKKYHPIGKKDMSIFPFNEMFYYILGDDNFIKPMNIKIREAIYNIGVDRKWNFRTKPEKIKRDILHTDMNLWKTIKKDLPVVYRY